MIQHTLLEKGIHDILEQEGAMGYKELCLMLRVDGFELRKNAVRTILDTSPLYTMYILDDAEIVSLL